jgi:hypothetical protein
MGTVGGILLDAEVHRAVAAEATLQAELLATATHLPQILPDTLIERLLSTLPAEILPAGLVVDASPPWRAGLPPPMASLLWGPLSGTHSGPALLDARKSELRRTLIWRRDNLRPALEAHLKPVRR